jgi:hypothetical protein
MQENVWYRAGKVRPDGHLDKVDQPVKIIRVPRYNGMILCEEVRFIGLHRKNVMHSQLYEVY